MCVVHMPFVAAPADRPPLENSASLRAERFAAHEIRNRIPWLKIYYTFLY